MYTDNQNTTKDTKEKNTQTFIGKEYRDFHDYFVELLSYNRKHNLCANNIWAFCNI